MNDHERLLWIATFLLKTWKEEQSPVVDADAAVEEFRASEQHLATTEESK